jgi:sugar/nucleoside kinase (ribokinase family)
MSEKQRIVCVGEVMVELARGADGRFGLAYGGDTFNTAVYLARADVPVAYATALGDDAYSDGIVSLAAAEGVNADLMLRVPGRMASAGSSIGARPRRRASCSSCRNGAWSPTASSPPG